jgi:predicted nucleic acid-binding protein
VPVYYLEPSALVKYYVTEPGSTWVRRVVDVEENVLVSAEVTMAEVAAALGVIARMGRISRRQRDAFWGSSGVICCGATNSFPPTGQSSRALQLCA